MGMCLTVLWTGVGYLWRRTVHFIVAEADTSYEPEILCCSCNGWHLAKTACSCVHYQDESVWSSSPICPLWELTLSSSSRSCCRNPAFGPMSRFRRTAVMASANNRPWQIIRYAKTSAPERLTPMAQCTNTLPARHIDTDTTVIQRFFNVCFGDVVIQNIGFFWWCVKAKTKMMIHVLNYWF